MVLLAQQAPVLGQEQWDMNYYFDSIYIVSHRLFHVTLRIRGPTFYSPHSQWVQLLDIQPLLGMYCPFQSIQVLYII